MAIETMDLTDAAVKAVKEAMEVENLSREEVFLRVGVKAGGCSGYSYMLAFDAQKREDDAIIEKDGVRVLVDPKSGTYLAGTILDYTSGLKGTGFVFQNPNVKSTCGCGNSFCT